MKKLLSVVVVFFTSYQALSCDLNLQAFSRDCAIQDRLASIRAKLYNEGIDLNEIGEYKGVRFIARGAWDSAMLYKKAPTDIYNPAPATWNVWENGIDLLFKNKQNKNAVYNNQVVLDQSHFSRINTVLLTDGTTSIKDAGTDQRKKPGEFRHKNDIGVGYCAGSGDAEAYRNGIDRAEASMKAFQKKWEAAYGLSFKDIVRQHDGLKWRRASLEPGMNISGSCAGGVGVFIGYSSSYDVENQIDWIRIFIKTNLEAIQRGQGVISPVALAAIVQKWFVSVHPFADGNGRTSRAVQDNIMANFDLPFVPGGDLQNDAMEDAEVYIENTYNKIEALLSKLETCADNRSLGLIPRTCRTINELNNNLINDDQQAQLEAQLKLKVP